MVFRANTVPAKLMRLEQIHLTPQRRSFILWLCIIVISMYIYSVYHLFSGLKHIPAPFDDNSNHQVLVPEGLPPKKAQDNGKYEQKEELLQPGVLKKSNAEAKWSQDYSDMYLPKRLPTEDVIYCRGMVEAGATVLSSGAALKDEDFYTAQGDETCQSVFDSFDHKFSRDFKEKPYTITGMENADFRSCPVSCVFSHSSTGYSDFDMVRWALRTMESAVYYPHTKVETAHDNGIQVVMTPRLDSDVPVGYFSWAEYNFGQAAPLAEDQSTTMASAVISNCGGSSHRLTSINSLEGNGVSMDKFGSCFQNRYQGSKYDVIKKYKFHMAFENSIEKDYVTEKYLQALVVGVVPVVIGAPNIHDFIPSPNSVLYIPSAEDAPRVAEQIKYLWNNETAYKEMLAWKTDGPWAPFLALVDMAVVHSSCRLCIHQATKMYLKELNEKIDKATGSCLCKEAGKVSRRYYHRLLVRERGTFEFISVTVTRKSLQSKITFKDLFSTIINTFKEAGDPFLPVWYGHRKDYRKSAEELEIYKLYPVGLTQRAALYGKEAIDIDEDVDLLLAQPCPKLEVIFV